LSGNDKNEKYRTHVKIGPGIITENLFKLNPEYIILSSNLKIT